LFSSSNGERTFRKEPFSHYPARDTLFLGVQNHARHYHI
jgi:hypothetical protein